MTEQTQPEALRLAAWLNEGAWHSITLGDVNAAGRELRRLHAENEQDKESIEQLCEQLAGVGDTCNRLEAENQLLSERCRLMQERVLELQSELVEEAQRTAEEKLRADQMTEQHRMQAAMNTEARNELAQFRSRPALSDEQIRPPCKWTYVDNGYSAHWETGCSNAHQFTDGGVEDNNHSFCPYCGGSIVGDPT